VSNYFGQEYLAAIEGILTPERTAQEVAFILEQTRLAPPALVGDFGCGHGRHAIEFARRGFVVVGVDVNDEYLRLARAAAAQGLSVDFVKSDYANPPAGQFDLIVSLFGSFGFSDDASNARALGVWCGRIPPGGWLVLELWNRDMIAADFQPRRVWRPSEQLEVEERRRFDAVSNRLGIHYIYTYEDGRRAEYDIEVRLYGAAEIQ
jgi:SAM-dependent methyltransferase